jgi:hypothetical protein
MCTLLEELDLVENLIADLAQSLPAPANGAFRQAALNAMARLTILGPGACYRAAAPLQANFFTPPSDNRATFDVSLSKHGGKLLDLPPIEHARRGPRGRPLPGVV